MILKLLYIYRAIALNNTFKQLHPATKVHLHKLGLIILLFGTLSNYAQTPQERTYATTQITGGTPLTSNVSNAGNAVDSDMATHSTMTITLLGDVWQRLHFSTPPDPNKDIHVKIGTSTGLLGLLNGVELRAYNGSTAVGSSILLGSLIGLIDGETREVIVFPAPGVPYDGIRVYYNGVALGGGIRVYGAYILHDTSNVACNDVADYLWGSTGGLLGGLNPVEDPGNAVDGDYTTYAHLRSNVGLLDKTFITALFDTPAQTGDSIRVAFRAPSSGLIDASLLASSLTIRTYYDNNSNGALALNPSLLSLSLLSGSSDVQVLSYPVPDAFNRIEVSLGEGLLSALESLHVFEIEKVPQGPELVSGPHQTLICTGENITLEIDNPNPTSVYNWYDDFDASIPIFTGDSYTTNIASTGTYVFYVAEIRQDCADESGRAFAVISAFDIPAMPELIEDTIYIITGDDAELEIDNPEAHITYNWYDENATLLGTGTIFTLTNITTDTTVYVEATVGDNCVGVAQAEAQILVVNLSPPSVTPTTQTIEEGEVATYEADTDYPGGVIHWYDENSDLVHIGEDFHVGPGLPPGTYTYTVTVVEPNTADESDPVTITLTITPAVLPTDCLDAYQRVYATGQTTGGTVLNASNAVDQNLETHSNIAVPLLPIGINWQQLDFGATYHSANGDNLHVKIGTDVALSVGSITLNIQAYESGNPVGTPMTLSSGLLNALAGENQADIIIANPGVSFDAVRITVGGGILSLGAIHVYEAYVNQEVATLTDCVVAEDVLHGVTSGALGALNGVTGAWNLVDEDMSTYAWLRQNVGVAGYAHATALYPAPSVVGDSIRITLAEQNAGLLDLTLLNGITIQTYMGNTPVETFPVQQGLLSVKLLSGPGNVYEVSTKVSQPFDRISVQLGGLVTALAGIHVFEIEYTAFAPVDGGDVNNHITACQGGTISLVPPDDSCTSYVWYDERFGGTVIGNNNLDFEIPASWTPGNYTVWIQPVRYGCENLARTPVTIELQQSPTSNDLDLATNRPEYCLGDDVVITATAPIFTDPVFTWYLDPNKDDEVADGAGIAYVIIGNELTITGLPVGTHTYYVSVKEGPDSCENAAGDLAEITIDINDPDTPTTTDNAQMFCEVDNPTVADIQVNETGVIWYDSPTGGTAYGPTDPLVDGQSYFGALVDGDCESSIRLDVMVTLDNPGTPTTNNTGQTFCEGNNPTVADIQVNETGVIWYDAPVGGTAYDPTDLLIDGQTYYGTLVSGMGCESSVRLEVGIAIDDVGTPTTLDTNQLFCAADNPTVDDIQVNETGVIWYDLPAGGTAYNNSDPLIDGQTYYGVLVSTEGCESLVRLEVGITIDDADTPTTLDTNQLFCAVDNPTVGDIQVNETGVIWYDTPAGGTAYNSTNPLIDGQIYYGVLVSAEGCESSIRLEVGITIDDADTPTTLDTNQLFCAIDNPTVGDIQVNETGVIWYDMPAGGSAYNNTDPLVDGQTYYGALVSTEGCESSVRLEVGITVDDADTPTTLYTNQLFCAVDNPTVGDIQVNEAAVIWYDMPTGGTAYNTTNPLVDGQTYYGALVSGAGCESSVRLAVSVTIEDAGTPTTSSNTQSFCAVDNPTVGNIQINETGVIWYDAPVGGTAYATTDLLVDGQVYYASLTSAGGCESSVRLEVNITIDDANTPTTLDTNQLFCTVDNPTVGDIQVNETGVVWYDAPVGGTAYPTTDLLVDGQAYYASLTSAGGCESSVRLEVSVTVDDADTPTTLDTNQLFCVVDNPTVGDIQVNETGVIWYDMPTGGTAYNTTNPLVDGQTYYGALVSGAGCESSVRLVVSVTIEDAGTPTTSSNTQSFCAVDNPTVGNIQVNETGVIWYDAPVGGNAYATTDLLVDGQVYYASLTSAGGCESTVRLEVTVTIDDAPTPTTVSNSQTFCTTDSATIADIQVNETGVIWYDSPVGGNAYSSTDLLVNGQTYYASLISAEGCESSVRLAVTIILEESQIATITSDAGGAVCLETYVTYTTESGHSNYLWDVTGGIVFSGGGLNDNFVEVLWDATVNTAVSVSFDSNTDCLNGDTVVFEESVSVCADITITKEVNELEPMVGDQITFTITVTNHGPNDFTDVEVSESIPSGFSLVSYSTTLGNYSPVSGNWTIGYLPAGETAVLVIVAEVLGSGDYLNIASITTSNPIDSDTGNNSAQVEVKPICLFVYNEFSPNADGINDYFVIACIENYPNNSLEIYNRYGSLVFKERGYSNTWNGVANVSGVSRRGEVLPSDTYYYVLKIGDGTKTKTGWLFLIK